MGAYTHFVSHVLSGHAIMAISIEKSLWSLVEIEIGTKRQISSGREEGRAEKQTEENMNTDTVDKIDVKTQGKEERPAMTKGIFNTLADDDEGNEKQHTNTLRHRLCTGI